MIRIEQIGEQRDSLGEGPLWDVDQQRLYWIDSYGPAVFSMDAAGGDRKRWPLPEPVGSIAIRKDGSGAVVALKSGFHLLDFASGKVTRINETHQGELRPRLNDGKVDKRGRFICGSMDWQEKDPIGKLFRLDPDFSLHELDDGIICSNGPCWSPSGDTLYFADSGNRVIYAYGYELATGEVRSKRTFTDFQKLRGLPDGATVDEEGYLWSCEVYSGRLIRFDPNGVVDRIVGLPVQSTTSIMFGGADLDIAFVTSMARPMGNEYHREREAGCLFAVHGLGVRGLPENRFGA